MSAYADLEISLFAQDKSSYRVELRYLPPTRDQEVKLLGKPLLVSIDTDGLYDLRDDHAAYAEQLSRFLSVPEIRSAFVRATDLAGAKVPLKIRLMIDDSAGRLHHLRWEMLADANGPLFTRDRILFSRFIPSYEPHLLRQRERLRCLAVFSNPNNLADYPTANGVKLQAIDVKKEAANLNDALEGTSIDPRVSDQPASIRNIKVQLTSGYDILYLLCHGAISREGEPQLWLEDDEGRTSVVDGRTLVSALRELRDRPTLVILASCQSAGADDEDWSVDNGVLSALGPRLADAGIPAVIAMQGNVSMKTASLFIKRLLAEIARDGEIDLAVARARSALAADGRPDWWVPALFMRLLNGRIWYEPGFADTEEIPTWPAVLDSISGEYCTVLVGPDVGHGVAGTRREIASGLAALNRFPLGGHQRGEFSRVAQYIETTLGRRFLARQIVKYTANEILDRFGEEIPPELVTAARGENVLDAVYEKLRLKALEDLDSRSRDPFSTLARLPVTRFITTQDHDLLEQALIREGKTPQATFCRWKGSLLGETRQELPKPESGSPLVFHLLGEDSTPASVVLTEDDQLDFLIGLTTYHAEIPAEVRRALSDSALIFLGFRIDSWEFLVLYRMIMNQKGADILREYSHVAVQVDPQEWGVGDPDAAARYLKKYFGPMNIAIYWGSTDDFLEDLLKKRGVGANMGKRA